MANLDLDIKNLPDDTYSVWLRRNSDGVEQFKSTLSFVGGLATAALSTASNGDYIEGAIFGNNNPAIRGVVVSGYAYGVDDSLGELFNDLEIYNNMELHA